MNAFGALPLFFNLLFNVLLLMNLSKLKEIPQDMKNFIKGLDGCWFGFSLFMYFLFYLFSIAPH